MRENLEIVFDKNGITAGFTNRLGGVSEGKFSSLNLGDHVGDNPADVIKNREILAQNLGVKKLKFMKQIHSDKVFLLENEDDELPECDAVVTNLSGVGICVLVADCSPVVMIDKRRGAICVAHAGRAGVMLKICSTFSLSTVLSSNFFELRSICTNSSFISCSKPKFLAF